MNPALQDPLVAEMRAVREELADRFGDDIDSLCDFLVERERGHEDRLVSRPSKSPRPLPSISER